ncbi:hypothetical protein ACQY0O_005336 [Thecaphora frezii]
MQSTLQSITHRLPPFLQRPAIALLGQECYTTLIYNADLSSTQCVKLAISKALGLGIIAFGSIIKLPQILNIVRASSATGISLTMYSLEVVAYTISLAYAVRARLPFSTYGENLSLTFQNMIITLLVILYSAGPTQGCVEPRSRRPHAVLAATLMVLGSVALASPSVIPPPLLTTLQALTIPISLASKVPQMLSLHRHKARGQLSAIVVVAQLLGTVARVFTTLTETEDRLLFYGFALATVFNAVIAVQVWMYRSNEKPMARQKKMDDGDDELLQRFGRDGVYPAGKPKDNSHLVSVATHETSRRSSRKLD